MVGCILSSSDKENVLRCIMYCPSFQLLLSPSLQPSVHPSNRQSIPPAVSPSLQPPFRLFDHQFVNLTIHPTVLRLAC